MHYGDNSWSTKVSKISPNVAGALQGPNEPGRDNCKQ